MRAPRCWPRASMTSGPDSREIHEISAVGPWRGNDGCSTAARRRRCFGREAVVSRDRMALLPSGGSSSAVPMPPVEVVTVGCVERRIGARADLRRRCAHCRPQRVGRRRWTTAIRSSRRFVVQARARERPLRRRRRSRCSQTLTDDIVLDETKPVIELASVGATIKARDKTSGVARVQAAVDRRRPGTALRYAKRVAIQTAIRPSSSASRIARGTGRLGSACAEPKPRSLEALRARSCERRLRRAAVPRNTAHRSRWTVWTRPQHAQRSPPMGDSALGDL
jgi:hypothetical protein